MHAHLRPIREFHPCQVQLKPPNVQRVSVSVVAGPIPPAATHGGTVAWHQTCIAAKGGWHQEKGGTGEGSGTTTSCMS
jgi:hypothetical protein